MFEPLTQTVSQLAVRWNCSVQDVLTHAEQRNWPLYFYFDGLVIDVNDRENRFEGRYRQAEEAAWLEKTIARAEETLTRNALHAQGKLEMTQWEEVLSDDAMRALRTDIEENKRSLRGLRESIEAWHEGRRRFHRNGAVRAGLATLQEVADRGVIPFPIRAYHPDSPAWFIPNPDGPGQLLEGRLVALEDMGPHPKAKLTADDIFANMADIKAIEAARSPTVGQTEQLAHPPAPAESPSIIEPKRPPQARQWQEQEILRAVSALGLTATAIPRSRPGKSGVKADVRKHLKLSNKVFDLAWERLRNDGRLADATLP